MSYGIMEMKMYWLSLSVNFSILTFLSIIYESLALVEVVSSQEVLIVNILKELRPFLELLAVAKVEFAFTVLLIPECHFILFIFFF